MRAIPVKKRLSTLLLISTLLGLLSPCRPDPAPPPEQTAQVSVDWGVTRAYTTPLLFGSNAWAVINPLCAPA